MHLLPLLFAAVIGATPAPLEKQGEALYQHSLADAASQPSAPGWASLTLGEKKRLLLARPELLKTMPKDAVPLELLVEMAKTQPKLVPLIPWNECPPPFFAATCLKKVPAAAAHYDLGKLTSDSWVDAIENCPQLLAKCDVNKLKIGDLCRLLTKHPELRAKVDEKRLKRGLYNPGSFEWENIVLADPNWLRLFPQRELSTDFKFRLAERHDAWFAKLKAKDFDFLNQGEFMAEDLWISFLTARPEALKFCTIQDRFLKPALAESMGSLFAEQPQLRAKFPGVKIDAGGWTKMLIKHPDLAKDCPWDEVGAKIDWIDLLEKQPQFIDKCPWDKLEPLPLILLLSRFPKESAPTALERIPIDYWGLLLNERPDLADKAPWPKLKGAALKMVGMEREWLAKIDLAALQDPKGWAGLLISRPDLIDQCPPAILQKIVGFDRLMLLSEQVALMDKLNTADFKADDWAIFEIDNPGRFTAKVKLADVPADTLIDLALSASPLAAKCDLRRLDEKATLKMLLEHPQMAPRLDLGKLGLASWMSALAERPELLPLAPKRLPEKSSADYIDEDEMEGFLKAYPELKIGSGDIGDK